MLPGAVLKSNTDPSKHCPRNSSKDQKMMVLMTMMVLMVVTMMMMMMMMMARWRRRQAVEKEVWSDCPACPSADRWFLIIARYEDNHPTSKPYFVLCQLARRLNQQSINQKLTVSLMLFPFWGDAGLLRRLKANPLNGLLKKNIRSI